MTDTRMDFKLLLLLYTLAFILLREWLIPINALTNTDHLGIFLVFIGLGFIFSLVKAKWWIGVPIKVLYIIWAVHFVFFDKFFLTKETVQLLLADLFSNVGLILNGDWEGITNPLRTLLFFFLLWMTTYLIRYWIEVKKSIFLFYFMTILFIAFIDTFSPFSAATSIFKIMITGLLLVGTLYITKLSKKHGTILPTSVFLSLSIPLLITVIVSGALANVAPKQQPIWPDPIPFFKSVIYGGSEVGNGTTISKSGYGTNDSTLGGAFVQDDTLVFEAKVPSKQYWKVETKNTYTSKGWEQEDRTEVAYELLETAPLVQRKETDSTSEEESFAQLSMIEEFPFIVYPYGVNKVNSDIPIQLMYLPSTGYYRIGDGRVDTSLPEYELEFKSPEYSMKQLRETEMESLANVTEDFKQYLQLPPELPDRVRALANEVAGEQESVYEKVKAIERYFGRNGFVYAQNDIAVPKEEDDYVDQFVFDTKRGYCDNFSTSMVVMLRSIDIPARWVKGFAPGESVRKSDGERLYQITNNEAHSWVEAYLPEIGWMPFEPTIGFTGQNDINYDIELDLSDPEAPAMKEKEKEKESMKKEKEKPKEQKKSASGSGIFSLTTDWLKKHLWEMGAILVALALVIRTIYVKRVKWLPGLLIRRFRMSEDNWKNYESRYTTLLRQLEAIGLKRAEGMTLSDYAVEVDNYFGGSNMARLTESYEMGLYGKNTTDQNWTELNEVWEHLIIRTSG